MPAMVVLGVKAVEASAPRDIPVNGLPPASVRTRGRPPENSAPIRLTRMLNWPCFRLWHSLNGLTHRPCRVMF